MEDDARAELQPRGNHRRNFLKTMGLAGAAVVSVPILQKAADATPEVIESGSTARQAVILLEASGSSAANTEFIKVCQSVMDANASRVSVGLERSVVQLTHDKQVYLTSVREADSWLRDHGYYASLDFYVKRGGRKVVVFDELDRITVPQYSTGRRGLGYLGSALKRNYQNVVSTLFPGPSEGLGRNGFYRYFQRYDLLTGKRAPLTFGEVFGRTVDPLLSNKTMLRHNGRGVFDGVALRYEPGKSYSSGGVLDHTVSYLEWMKELVDDSCWLYQSERVGAGKSEIKKGNRSWDLYVAGKGLAPFQRNGSYYYVHSVG